MIVIERRHRRTEGPSIEEVTLRQALLIGVAQCAAVVPGTSRSMATIMGGLWVGLPAATAAEFSFYLAIPTICGAGLLRIIKHPQAFSGDNVTIMVVGFVMAFVVAWLAVAGFMRYIQKRSLEPFAIYRVVLGGVVLIHWWLVR
jgi:undecaprenyl-diphosphatase